MDASKSIIQHVSYDRGYNDAKRRYESKWISIEDQVPEDDGRLIIYFFDGCGGPFLGFYFGRDEEYPSDNNHVFGSHTGFLTGDVTHWMHLPDYQIDHEEIMRNNAANAGELNEHIDHVKKPIGYPTGNDAEFGTSME